MTTPEAVSNPAVPPAKKTPWYLTRAAAIWGLVIVGPLALPLVLICPSFKKSTKIIITVVLVVLTYASWVYMPILLDDLYKKLEQYQSVVGVQ